MRREAKHAHLPKKGYTKPECIARSPAEIADFLRERLLALVHSRKPGSPTHQRLTPILLAQGYLHDSASIQDAAGRANLHGYSCADASDSELVRLPFQELEWSGSGAARPDFLLLDLRMSGKDGPEIVRKIRSRFNLGDLPLAILTAAGSETAFLEICGKHNTWRISGVSDPAQVVEGLQAVLQLWADVLKLSPSLAREVL